MGSDSFKTALLARERDRQLLAEALEGKFRSESRRNNVARLFKVALFGVFAVYLGKGIYFAKAHTKAPALNHAGPPPDILAEMKTQMSESDRMMIGGQKSNAPVPAKKEATRPRIDRGSFAQERVPLNLYDDLRKGPPRAQPNPGYDPPGAGKRKELEALALRRATHPPLDCGKYRPAVASDMPKLPPKASRPGNAHPDLYVRMDSVPARFAQDEPEFKVSK